MGTSRIGRPLPASLHQAIADLLPTRLEFYEYWISPEGLREGTFGLAGFTAVLSFLRREGEAYDLVMTRAGQYAAEWTVDGLLSFRRALIRGLPSPLRKRVVILIAVRMIRQTYDGSRAVVRFRRGVASIHERGSLFCEVREMTPSPLCGFYAAAIERMLERFGLRAKAEVSHCRAVGAPGCVVSVVAGRRRAARE